MKIMIFGDTASGKSSFAEKLAVIENVPLLHLDRMMEEIGRTDRAGIGARIVAEAAKPDWIIEGNAFTKDPNFRISSADRVYVFNFNRFTTLKNYLMRYIKLRFRTEVRKGSCSMNLNLMYFVPYILYKFPPRKKEALRQARSLMKDVIEFTSYADVDEYLRNHPAASRE